ncbi:hypothetical protein DNTS_021913 [Danionella cerebrum]|uniref:Saposin B-type domain-containing protein n=1 Tax=Danionella cerebrum TaxID=2873325 RepID=A0A553QP82_9TELE|nr:hypothetical protein DNTS_021913 [Danionella translucida]
MLRNIFLLSLLVHAVCSTHWEVREVDSAEDELEEIPNHGTANEKALFICSTCQNLLKSVKSHLSNISTPDGIKGKLIEGCNLLNFFVRIICKQFVVAHLHTLVDELMTNDGPRTICAKAGAC